MKAFEVEVNGRKLDYRVGRDLDLEKIKKFLETTYKVTKVWQTGRHVFASIEKYGKELFFKLATTEGISYLTKAEYEWNDAFNSKNPRKHSTFWVPQNSDCGLYENSLFYLITDKLHGRLVVERPEKTQSTTMQSLLPSIIEFSELIQRSDLQLSARKDDFLDFFRTKMQSWYTAIPQNILKDHNVAGLLTIIETTYKNLEEKPRHGDFTPWHIFDRGNGELGLIDGEHALESGVEYYDIAYFIQRIFSVLEDPKLAKKIVLLLLERNYDISKLKTVLAARGIGGYLDESLREKPNYALCDSFRDFVHSLDASRVIG